jgi:hypothetical protein
MTFIVPFISGKSANYNVDIITTSLSLAVSLIDDFTKREDKGHLKVMIKEGNISPIKNLSGYYIFTGLADGIYTLKIESEFYFPEERVIDVSKIKTSNIILKFYSKGPASRATSTRLKDVSKLQTGDVVEFNNLTGGVEQRKIRDIDVRTKKISWEEGLKYSFNTADNVVLAPGNPVVTIPLKPLPSYPFYDNSTLVRGLLIDSGKNPVADTAIKVTDLNLETKSDKMGEFVLYFNSIKSENISFEIERNGKNKTVNTTLKEGMMKYLGKIIFP